MRPQPFARISAPFGGGSHRPNGPEEHSPEFSVTVGNAVHRPNGPKKYSPGLRPRMRLMPRDPMSPHVLRPEGAREIPAMAPTAEFTFQPISL